MQFNLTAQFKVRAIFFSLLFMQVVSLPSTVHCLSLRWRRPHLLSLRGTLALLLLVAVRQLPSFISLYREEVPSGIFMLHRCLQRNSGQSRSPTDSKLSDNNIIFVFDVFDRLETSKLSLHQYTDMQENTWARLRDSRSGAHAIHATQPTYFPAFLLTEAVRFGDKSRRRMFP